MINQLLRKWFGLPEPVCASCELLRDQLDESNRERRELLQRLLERDKPEPPQVAEVANVPITPPFVPWRVRQQMLEKEDRRAAQILRDREKEIRAVTPPPQVAENIAALEQELGVSGTEGN